MADESNGPDKPPAEDEFYDRRSGEDRRSGRDRRRGGRRRRPVDVPNDRRSGADRRKGPRRRIKDRRRYVDPRYKKTRRETKRSQYSPENVERVQYMLSRVGHGVTCPVCEGPFTLGPVDRRGGDLVRQVWCAQCGRGTVVTNCVLVRVMVLTGVPPMRDALVTILNGAGHEVLTPPDVDAAFDVYRENPADVVLLDAYALEEMDGKEFIRVVRRDFPDAYIAVIAPRLSYRTADPSAAATRLGAARVVRMPFTKDDILRVIKEARP